MRHPAQWRSFSLSRPLSRPPRPPSQTLTTSLSESDESDSTMTASFPPDGGRGGPRRAPTAPQRTRVDGDVATAAGGMGDGWEARLPVSQMRGRAAGPAAAEEGEREEEKLGARECVFAFRPSFFPCLLSFA